jgi:hypothetical protein
MATGLMTPQFTDFNGQQVRTDDGYKQSLTEGAAMMGMAAQDYDKLINPDTYGARWGIPAPAASGATTTAGATNTTGSTTLPGSNTALPTAAQVTPGGLMSTPAQAAANVTARDAVATGYTANTTEVNKPTDTVQGQIEAIIAKNSPLMQRAEARSNEQMTARGLQNSSMAVGAGQAALYDVALPIANSDANAYNATRFNNQTATNTASQFGAAAQNQAALANADRSLQAGVVNQQQANEMAKFNAETSAKLAIVQLQNSADVAKFNASQSNDLIKLGMDAQTRANLANIEATYKNQLQSSASASDMYKQAITTYAGILTNKDMAPEAKTTAMNDIVTGLNDGLRVLSAISGLELGSMIDFTLDAPSAATLPTNTTNGLMVKQGDGGSGGDNNGSDGGGVNGSAGSGDGDAMG